MNQVTDMGLAAHGQAIIRKCSHCGTERGVQTTYRKKTRDLIYQLGIKLPTCSKCLNQKVAGIPEKSRIDSISSLHQFIWGLQRKSKDEMKGELTHENIKVGQGIAHGLKRAWRVMDMIWEGVRLDVDSLDELPPKARKMRIPQIQKRIRRINSLTQFMRDFSYRLSKKISLNYREERQNAKRELKKEWFRNSIMLAAGFKCAHCGSSNDLEIDHIIPVIRGGATEHRNLQVLCQPCNTKKGVR